MSCKLQFRRLYLRLVSLALSGARSRYLLLMDTVLGSVGGQRFQMQESGDSHALTKPHGWPAGEHTVRACDVTSCLRCHDATSSVQRKSCFS